MRSLTFTSLFFVLSIFLSACNSPAPVITDEAAYLKSIEAWQQKRLERLKDKNGSVVSVHKAKVQLEDGTTTCFGTYKTKSGNYADWRGTVTELDSGEVIGQASLN